MADTAKNNLPNWKNENYLTVYGWMTNELKLTGNELLIYALIYGFTKEFRGSTRYIATALNTSRRTVFNALKNLMDRRLVVKKETGRFCNYSVTPMQNLHTTYEKIAQIPMQNLHTTYEKIAHHIDSNITNDIDVDRAVDDSTTNQTTTNYKHIQEIAKSQGFFITSKQAKGFYRLDPAWLEGDSNFLAFAAERIRANPEKSRGDKERIFAKAWSYENLLQEFPQWRESEITEAAKREEQGRIEATADEKRRKLDQARAKLPDRCDHCGKPFAPDAERGNCPACGWEYVFNENSCSFSFNEQRSLSEEFKKQFGMKKAVKEHPSCGPGRAAMIVLCVQNVHNLTDRRLA
jgi:predicted transcriptional regulator